VVNAFSISIEAAPDETELKQLEAALFAFNRTAAGHEGYRPIVCLLRDAHGAMVGGITGSAHHRWFSIDLFWVREDVRGLGHGSRLLKTAEQEAIRHGCLRAHLDTHSFQAPGFYLKHGYEVFGELPDFPHGQSRLFMTKRLEDQTGAKQDAS